MKKVLSIGKDDFKKLIDGNCYYIDKSQLICDLINDDNQATLITRPRRFGKSLNMSMLKYFFEKSEQDNKYLFDGLEVSKNEKYMQEQGKYPVISISLSSLKARNFEENLKQFHLIISEEFKRHEYEVFNYLSNADEIELYKQISNVYVKLTDISILTYSLKFLSKILEQVYHQKVIILIDEYDVPLDNAYFNGFYDEMINFIRVLFESAIKGNQALHMTVLTGCLRISKESIFTGMNNLVAYSVINKEYSKCYGFTELEITQMLEYYNLQDKFDTIKTWYDGYLYGNTEIYNPWSVLNYIKALINDDTAQPMPYWSNSSSNSIIRKLIIESSIEIKQDIENLVNNNIITKPLYENMTYKDMETDKPSIWRFLLHTGYLKLLSYGRENNSIKLLGKFAIPNLEISTIFTEEIQHWTDDILRKTDNTYMLNALLEKNPTIMEQNLNKWLLKTISYYDTKEKESFYHGLLLGLFSNFENYRLVSNRESGDGRFDIVIKDYQYNTAIILELKVENSKKELSKECDTAINQIDTKHYDTDLIEEGYTNILKYGIAFFNKLCMVKY